MSIAPSFISSKLPNLYTVIPCRSSPSMPTLLRPINTSSRRYGSLAVHSIQSSGIGGHEEPTKKIQSNMETERSNKSPSLPLPKAPTWLKWTLGSIVWLSLPSWKKLQSVQEVVTKVDSAVEVIEVVVEATEKMVENVAEELPEGGGMKKAVLGLEKASEAVVKDVKAVDAFVDKVGEQVEEWKEKAKEEGEKVDEEKDEEEKKHN